MSKISSVVVGVVVVGLGVGIAFYSNSARPPMRPGGNTPRISTNMPSNSPTSSGTSTDTEYGQNAPANMPENSPTSSGPTTYTAAEIAKHNDASSCWTSINGGVYDLTNWINQHPGGPDYILALCGTDGSAAFNNQHGGQGRPEAELATFKIGVLAQ